MNFTGKDRQEATFHGEREEICVHISVRRATEASVTPKSNTNDPTRTTTTITTVDTSTFIFFFFFYFFTQRYGVHTLSTQVHRVVNLVVPKNNLKGPLIDEVRWLDKLKTLALPSNELSGSIPPAWSTLTSLTMLDLSNNHITGTLREGRERKLRRKRIEMLPAFFFK
jgi:hypothetical protein